jgi:hypothetical protein
MQVQERICWTVAGQLEERYTATDLEELLEVVRHGQTAELAM